ncbi:MAG: hypothetical protein ABI789_02110 [Usitatibacter sp.]
MPVAIDEILARLQRNHDSDLPGAAEELRAIAPGAVPPAETARYTWLVNHVIGENLGSWQEVQAIYRRMQPALDELPAAALRNLAAAAALAGDERAARLAIASLGRAAGVDEPKAVLVAQMARVMYGMPTFAKDDAAEEFMGLCHAALEWSGASGADALVAGMANNVVSAWLETPHESLRSPAIRRAMEVGALASRHFWQKAGTPIQKARADYLVAMTMNRIGKPVEARVHALAALATLGQGGTHDVDRAFIGLELAHAELRLGSATAAAAARREAEGLAAVFSVESTRQWFADTAAKLDASRHGAGL